MNADSRGQADREKRRSELLSLLGDLPPETGTPPAEIRNIHDHDGYALEELRLELNGRPSRPRTFQE